MAAKRTPTQGAGHPAPNVIGVTTHVGPGFGDPQFVEYAFTQWCYLTGFDLPAFDAWLSAQPDSPAMRELQEKRAAALAAFGRNPNDEAGILWHRDYMLARWRHLADVDFLKPLARSGKVIAAGRSKGGKNKTTPEWHEGCIKRAKAFLSAGCGPREVVGELHKIYDRDKKTIRTVLQNERVLPRRGVK